MSSAVDGSASFSSMGLSEDFARGCLKFSFTLTSLAAENDGDWSRFCCWWSPVKREITLNINFGGFSS